MGLRVQADARAALVEETNLGQVVRTYEPHQRTPSPWAKTVMTMGDGQIVGTGGTSHATASVAAGKGVTHNHNQGSRTGASRAGKRHHGIGHAGGASGAVVGGAAGTAVGGTLGGLQQGPQVEGTHVVRHEQCMQPFSCETSTAKSA